MNPSQPTKSKRSTMACIHCRERKVKCDNNNDGLPCERCKKTKKDCRYEPVTAVADSQSSASPPGDPPITGDKPIMTVYQDPSPTTTSPPAQVNQWTEVIDPHLRSLFPVDGHGRPLHTPYDSMNPSSLSYQPPQAYPQGQFSVGSWQQQPFIHPQVNQPPFYGQQESYPTAGHGFWTGSRGPNVSNDKSGDRPEDGVGDPSRSS